MNYFECCRHCVAPKRYPGCSGKCPEYAAGKAKLEADKAKLSAVVDFRCYIGNKHTNNLDAAAKYAKKHNSRKYK